MVLFFVGKRWCFKRGRKEEWGGKIFWGEGVRIRVFFRKGWGEGWGDLRRNKRGGKEWVRGREKGRRVSILRIWK